MRNAWKKLLTLPFANCLHLLALNYISQIDFFEDFSKPQEASENNCLSNHSFLYCSLMAGISITSYRSFFIASNIDTDFYFHQRENSKKNEILLLLSI